MCKSQARLPSRRRCWARSGAATRRAPSSCRSSALVSGEQGRRTSSPNSTRQPSPASSVSSSLRSHLPHSAFWPRISPSIPPLLAGSTQRVPGASAVPSLPPCDTPPQRVDASLPPLFISSVHMVCCLVVVVVARSSASLVYLELCPRSRPKRKRDGREGARERQASSAWSGCPSRLRREGGAARETRVLTSLAPLVPHPEARVLCPSWLPSCQLRTRGPRRPCTRPRQR